MKMLHYRLLGLLSLGVGTLGVFLPLLPTTCFVLLSAWCFAKSSPKLHQWLLSTPLFGGMIRQWEEERCISAKAQRMAVASMVFFGGISLLLLENTLLRLVLLAVVMAGIYTVLTINQRRISR